MGFRFLACPNRCGFFLGLYNWIDLAAGPAVLVVRVFSFFIIPMISADSVESTLRRNFADSFLFCVVPVLRLLRMLRRFEKIHLLLRAFELAFEALPVLLFTLSILVL